MTAVGRFLVVAGVALAFGAGFAAGRFTSAESDTPTEPQRPAPREPAPAPAPPRASRAAEQAAPLDAATKRAADEALAATPAAATPQGTGVISGSVRTTDGRPIAGVQVVACPSAPAAWAKEIEGKRWDDIPLDVRVARFVREQRWRETSKRIAESGADGRFSLSGVGDVDYQVWASSPDRDIRAAPGMNTGRVRPGATLEFVASDAAQVAVDVRMPDGTQPATANLRANRTNTSTGSNWSAAQPRMMLDPGTWRLTATAGDDGRFASKPVDVTVNGGGAAAPAPVVLQLEALRGIVVRLHRPEGFGSSAPKFWCVAADGADPTDDDIRAGERDRHEWDLDEPRWDSSDRLVRMGLAPGRYVVAASVLGGPLGRKYVQVDEGVVECDLDVPAPDASMFLDARVTGPDGAAVPRATFEWRFKAPKESGSYSAKAVARGDGRYLVRVVQPGESPQSWSRTGKPDPSERTWTLAVTVDSLGTRLVSANPQTDRSATVRFDAPGTLAVRVEGIAAADRSNFELLLGLKGEGRSTSVDVRDGAARFEQLSPGTYRLSLRAKSQVGDHDDRSYAVEEREVQIASGDSACALTAPALTRVVVEGGKDCPDAFAHVTASGKSNEWEMVTLDGTGRADLGRMPPGEYTLSIRDKPEKTFRVPETTVVRY